MPSAFTIMSQETAPFIPDGGDDMIVGQIFAYGGPTLPAKCLRADGSAVSRATYGALFALYGTTWGAGDGVTTFNLPDLRGRVLLGAGAGPGLTVRTLAASGGEETHTLIEAEQPVHTHGVTDPGHLHDLPVDPAFAAAGAVSVAGSSGPGSTPAVMTTMALQTTGLTVNNSAGGSPHANMQPWVAAYPLIYAGV